MDVFAAGAMLFMMLTGFPPFSVASRADSSFKQLVWKGDVQGLLRRFRVPRLPTEVIYIYIYVYYIYMYILSMHLFIYFRKKIFLVYWKYSCRFFLVGSHGCQGGTS